MGSKQRWIKTAARYQQLPTLHVGQMVSGFVLRTSGQVSELTQPPPPCHTTQKSSEGVHNKHYCYQPVLCLFIDYGTAVVW